MKYTVLSHSAGGELDAQVWYQLFNNMPGRVESEAQADVVFVLVTVIPNYVFNNRLISIKKPVVLIDYSEYGGDYSFPSNDVNSILGSGSPSRIWRIDTPEWNRLDTWVKENPPVVRFQRELRSEDANPSLRIHPCDWLCMFKPMPPQSKLEFLSRRLQMFSYWGNSWPVREKLHGEIFTRSVALGYVVIDHPELLAAYCSSLPESKFWMSFHAQYARLPMETVISMAYKSKLCVSLPGAGVKCMRHSEAPVASVMVLARDRLVYSFPWVDGENCLRLDLGTSMVDQIMLMLDRPDLWDIYQLGLENVDRYRPVRYIQDYLIPIITKVL